MNSTRHPSHTPSVQTPNPVRSRARIALYLTVSAIGLIALSLSFFDFFGLSKAISSPLVNKSANARDMFDGLYQIGWRSDGSAGNTAIEAVYYYPALFQALAAYTDRSAFQDETFQELNKFPDMALYPFLVVLQRNEQLDTSFTPDTHLSLMADGSDPYTVDRWQPLSLPDTSGNSIAGIVWFRQPSGVPLQPSTLELTFDGVPGNTKQTRFSWNNSVLSLVDITAK